MFFKVYNVQLIYVLKILKMYLFETIFFSNFFFIFLKHGFSRETFLNKSFSNNIRSFKTNFFLKHGSSNII